MLDDFYGHPSSAVDAFTDRVPESVSFAEAIRAHLRRLDDPDASSSSPRWNVLTFHGVGGHGKSELSKRLERWIAGDLGDASDWGPAPHTNRTVLTTRIDLAEREILDVERLVLELRATLGASELQTDAFDIALALWWRQYHGDEPVYRLPSRRTSTSSAAQHDLREQLKDTSVAVLQELGAGVGLAELGIRLAKRLKHVATERRQRMNAEGNEWFARSLEELSKRSDLETLSKLPILLREDIRRLPSDERPLWVVFVDTFEHANGGDTRHGERAFQRVVYAMQDVLWVFTGRSRLDWGEPERAGALEVVGARQWPGLAFRSSDSMQHAIGDLSDLDARRFIARVETELSIAVPPETVDVIVRRSAGSERDPMSGPGAMRLGVGWWSTWRRTRLG